MNSFGKLVDKFVDNTNWKLSKSTLYFKRLVWIPVCTERNGTLFIYLSKQIRKEVILLLKLLDEKDEFYFMSPIFSNPKYKYIDEDFHKNEVFEGDICDDTGEDVSFQFGDYRPN